MISSFATFQDPFLASKLSSLKAQLSDVKDDFSLERTALIQSTIAQIAKTIKSEKNPLRLIDQCEELEKSLSPLRAHLHEVTGRKRLRSVSTLSSCIDTTLHELWNKVHFIVNRTLSTTLELIPKREQSIKNKALLVQATSCMSYLERSAFITDLQRIPSNQRVAFLKSWMIYLEMHPEMSQNKKNALLLQQISLGSTPLHHAAQSGNRALIKKLINDPKTKLNAKNHAGNTPLHHAIFSTDPECVEMLLSCRRVDVNARNQILQTPLYWAVIFKNIRIVELLLEHGKINPNLKNSAGETPLVRAALFRSNPILPLLITKGADSRIRDQNGDTAYLLQKMMGATPSPLIYSDQLGYLLKMASLIWGFNGSITLPDGFSFNFEGGGEISIPLSLMISNLSSLPYLIKKAFFDITVDQSMTKILSSLSRKKLVILTAGYEGHANALVIYQELLFICDRGNHSKSKCLRVFRINPENITIGTLEILKHIKESPEEEALKYYYEQLPAELTDGDYFEELTPIFSRLEPKEQQASNCSAASLKLAIRASLCSPLLQRKWR